MYKSKIIDIKRKLDNLLPCDHISFTWINVLTYVHHSLSKDNVSKYAVKIDETNEILKKYENFM